MIIVRSDAGYMDQATHVFGQASINDIFRPLPVVSDLLLGFFFPNGRIGSNVENDITNGYAISQRRLVERAPVAGDALGVFENETVAHHDVDIMLAVRLECIEKIQAQKPVAPVT